MSGKAAPKTTKPPRKSAQGWPRPDQGGRPSGSCGKMARSLVAQINVKHLRDVGNDSKQFFREK